MASLSIINKVKYSPWLYNAYYYIGSAVVSLVGRFIRKDPRLIMISSYGGRKYDDSPRCIYEEMIKDHRFGGYKIVWAFLQPDNINIPRGEKVRSDTFAYYKTLLKAKCWITNSSMERGLSIDDKKKFYYNSWHGTPIKLMGGDRDSSNSSFYTKSKKCPYDVFCAQSQFDAEIFGRSFGIPKDVMKIIGLPRNDELANDAGEERKRQIREKLEIPKDKKVILYAPTFREYTKDDNLNCIIAPPIKIKKWKEFLGDKYVLLFRAHYEVVKVMNLVPDGFLIDVSEYSYLNELMIVSDILISDYSSIFFDYSIMGKPMLCFAYDYKEYVTKRGLYFDIRKELQCLGMDTEDDVINEILNMDMPFRESISKAFRNKYVTNYGKATTDSLDIIYEALNH